jgi:hypothetical protein
MNRKTARALGWIALSAVLLAALAAVGLPLFIRYKINSGMAQMTKGYAGHVEDVSIAWLDGTMSAHRLRIERPGRQVGAPFLLVREIQMNVLWREASKPRLGLRFLEPILNFIDAPGEANDQKGPGFTLAKLREKLPLDLGAVELENLEIHFRNFHAKPAVDTYVQNVHASAAPLDRCIQEPPVGCEAKARLEGLLMRDGKLRADINFAYDKAFALNARALLEGLTLKDLNPLLLRYADVDVQEGSLSLKSRARVDGATYRVVLNPSLKDAKVVGGNEDETKAGREIGLALAARFLERMGEDLSITLTGGPQRDLDWDITRRESNESGKAPTSKSPRAHASVAD